MMDTVFLRDLKIDTVIGIYGWERRVRQTLIFDLEMSADVAKAAKTDKIEDALNYKSIAKRLQQYVGESEFELIETLAEECARIIREEFNVAWVKLTLNKKGAVRGATDVGVIIERGERTQWHGCGSALVAISIAKIIFADRCKHLKLNLVSL